MDNQVTDYKPYFVKARSARILCYACLSLCGTRLFLGLLSLVVAIIPLPGPLMLIGFIIAILTWVAKITVTGAIIAGYVVSVVQNVKLSLVVRQLEICKEAVPLRVSVIGNQRLSKITGIVLILTVVLSVIMNSFEFVLLFL